MENHFAFLTRARPASLHRLLGELPPEDAAIALAGLPPAVSVQVMAYFPEKEQAGLMQAMRDARRAGSARAAQAAERVKKVLLDMKRGGSGPAAPNPSPAAPAQLPGGGYPQMKPGRPAPGAPASQSMARPDPSAPPPERRPDPGAEPAKPTPWVPRAASSSPINGPAIPGKPPPVAGDPLKSPLAKAGLLDLIGRAQDKFMPKSTAGAPPREPRPSAAPSRTGLPAGKRPAPREGVTRAVAVGKTPRVIGGGPGRRPPPDAPAAPDGPPAGARRMDGKAILAAILRNAGSAVRRSVRDDDPSLYRELKGRMFFFDDLIYTEDSALARVFTAAPAPDSALALKFAAPALRDRVFRVVSPGRAEALRDVPPVRGGLDAVESAQKKVLDVALQLQAAGRILIDPRDPDLAT